MTKILTACAGIILMACQLVAADYTLHGFEKSQLLNQFWGEGANFGDFNHDKRMDIVSGPYWWEGPEFKTRHEYYPATKKSTFKNKEGKEETFPGFSGALGNRNDYSDNFFAYTHDFNGDGWDEILILGFPGAESFVYENPQGKTGPWKRHMVLDVTDNESPAFGDLTGDGKPEIICNSKGYFGYAEPDWNQPFKPWVFHPITPNNKYHKFTHGIGYGDVNGDGRMDILEKNGWWEQPASLKGDPVWVHHPVFLGTGGAQMFAYDVNGDGLNDIITSLAAHGYGLTWYEQYREGGEIKFRDHTFMNKEPEENKYGVHFSQLHAIDLVDMDGDGLKDIVTGKRFWAHGPTGDPEPGAPAVLYWFKLVRGAGQSVDFVPYLIDNDSGVGTQVVTGDVNGDGLMDVVVGNKMGTFVHLHKAKKVTQEEWKKAQPKPLKVAQVDDPNQGLLPLGADGKPLNLDFEQGSLKDWKAEGQAFAGQPIKGDKVSPRRGDMKSNHQGNYWIGTYEVYQDAAHGTLTSVPFKVTHPYASFLIAGGPYEGTSVELLRAADQKVVFKVTGFDGEAFRKSNNASETLRPVVVDLTKHQGQEIIVRVLDQGDGHWGHVNFDNFRFHAARPEFPDPVDLNRKALPKDPLVDVVKFESLEPEAAAREMSLPEGFSATLFAGEPDVKQPVAFAIDHRGRVWVAEAYTYPARAPDGKGKDRILVFEDTNGNGKFNERTVFKENLNLVSGLEVGFGGVYVGAAPYLMFIPDRNGDLQPDGDPQILLDGWAWQDTHETLNTFTWGPDGWLYGCHGIFTHSKVGKPGTPDEQRTKINAGVWRYHPTRHEFELFAEGTSNPWGIDFDRYGQCIMEACVIPHLFHMIQGGRYQRQAGRHFNPYVYDDIKTIGDHLHYAGNRGPHAGNNRSGSAGGGHAHAGLLIYQEESWPEQFRNKIYMGNIHGHRINTDILVRKGSGFVGMHGKDLINFNDKSSQTLNMLADQDGSVFIIDWYDINQCHHGRYDGHDRSNGRIFKITYKNQKWNPVDLNKKTNEDLVRLQLSDSEWMVRHARRVLQERGGNAEVHLALEKLARGQEDPGQRVRALWALHATGGLPEDKALTYLKDQNEYVRSWAIQLMAEDREVGNEGLSAMASMAKEDKSPVVRLYLAAALQRLPLENRIPVLNALLTHEEDADDHNLPLMYWYAAEPLAGQNAAQAVALLSKTKIPLVRKYIAQRMAASRNSSQSASVK